MLKNKDILTLKHPYRIGKFRGAIFYSIPFASAVALLLFSVISINPLATAAPATYAEEGLVTQADDGVALTITNNNSETTTVAKVNETAYSSYTVAVKADAIESYTLQISGPANLTPDLGSTVVSGASGQTGPNLAANTWGYGWGATSTADASLTYSALSESGKDLAGDAVANNAIDFSRKLAFAVKFGEKADAAHYRAYVVLSMVTTPKKVATTWDELSFMQDMTTTICSNAASGSTKYLTDTRDGNKYWIAKLKDNNCWMTQNLDYDYSNSTSYYDPGYYIYTKGATIDNCGSSVASLDNCTTHGWTKINTTTMSPSSDPNFASAISGNIYNAHYLVGNYYFWSAATNGTSASSGKDAPDSICPDGWKLPNQATLNSLSSGLSSAALAISPYYIPLSGKFNYFNGNQLSSVGETGYLWTSTLQATIDGGYSYALLINPGLNPNMSSPYTGDKMPMRCVAK